MSSMKEKQPSSLGAVRHDLLARYSVNNLECAENFDVVVQDHVHDFEPEGGVQEGFIEEMASAYWRMRRLSAIENCMMNQAIDNTPPDDTGINRITEAFSSLAGTSKYNRLNIYEDCLHRRYHRTFRSMLTLSEYRRRKARIKKQEEEANPA